MLNHPTIPGVEPLGQRRNMAHTGTVYINDALQRHPGNIIFALVSGIVKRTILTSCDKGCLNNSNLIDAGSQSLSDQRNIILDALREHPLFQPNAGKDMTDGSNQQRM